MGKVNEIKSLQLEYARALNKLNKEWLKNLLSWLHMLDENEVEETKAEMLEVLEVLYQKIEDEI